MNNDKLKNRDAYFSESGRVPPQNKEAEDALIGACMIVPDAINKVSWIKPEEFYFEENRNIYQCIYNLNADNRNIDNITVAEEMKRIDSSIMMSEVLMKTKVVASDNHIIDHAKIIRKLYNQRRLIEMSYNVLNYAY